MMILFGNNRWVDLYFAYCDPSFMLTLFKFILSPRIDYSSQFWCPHLWKDIIALEKPHRFYTKHISYKTHYQTKNIYLFLIYNPYSIDGKITNHIYLKNSGKHYSKLFRSNCLLCIRQKKTLNSHIELDDRLAVNQTNTHRYCNATV